MFRVHEAVETYNDGIETLYDCANVKCETYEEAKQEFEKRTNVHIEAGHYEDFKGEKAAFYADFDGGKYAVASYTIMIIEEA